MEQFFYGLLAGVALGMWLAILLYTFAGRRYRWRKSSRIEPSDQADTEHDSGVDEPIHGAGSAAQVVGARDERQDGAGSQQSTSGVGSAASTDDAPDVHTAPHARATLPLVEYRRQVFDSVELKSVGERSAEDVKTRHASVPGDEAYQRLIARVDGDAAAAARLILYERERSPAAPFDTLVQNALDRLQYGPQ